MDKPNDLPCILSWNWNFTPRVKTNMAWPSCIRPCKNTRNYSCSCCSLIGQSEARTTPTVWNWSGKAVSPRGGGGGGGGMGGNIARYDFPSPPQTAPGSPRMDLARSL